MGADVVLKKDDGRTEEEQLNELLQNLTEQYESQGEKVYSIPMGGSNIMGMCGYFECAQELDLQCRELSLKSPRLVCAVGSLGTYMGLYCGLQEIESDLRLTGIAISPFEEEKSSVFLTFYAQVCQAMGLKQRRAVLSDRERLYPGRI